jgi:purine nucleosidase
MMNIRRSILHWLVILILLAVHGPLRSLAQPAAPKASQSQLVILDTDIGDDIDDAFALALALQSPEFKLLGITTTYGQTHVRARIVDRYLHAVGRAEIPIAAGAETAHPNPLTQSRYAANSPDPDRKYPSATTFALEQIRLHPNEITLIAIGPLFNVGAMIDADPSTFRKLRRVVMMGGSIYRRYGDLPFLQARGPEPEWNILRDIESARKLLASGVPVYVMPLDSTQLKLDETKREILFGHGTPLTDQLTLLYHQWGQVTPTLFDPMAVAYALNPNMCPVTRLHIHVDDKGYTRVEEGTPNVWVCLQSDSDKFFNLLMPRLLESSSAK